MARSPGWRRRYVGHVYVTYVSLRAGLLIVAALALPAPQMAVPLVVGVVSGNVLIGGYRRRPEA